MANGGQPVLDAGRVLVFVVAYHAEKHIVSVFERVPKPLFNAPDVAFLVIDDASGDGSADILARWVEAHAIRNITVLRNPVNQGYGGNQKLGYRVAVDQGFGLVILLHGDGQYAPEMLPSFIDTWRRTDADVILGSRMRYVAKARVGGMPLYKIAGNRTLTWFQNRLTGQALSEYHTGYRAYSTRLLRAVPFEVNTNDFHFDTEILLQAHYVGARVEELDIPTHYGDEVCHVNSVQYGINVLLATARYAMHRRGMVCSLKYRNLSPLRYPDKGHLRYSSHALALGLIEEALPKRLLDVGCGPGFVAQRCEALGCRVTGLDRVAPQPGVMSEFRQLDLEKDPLPVDPFAYDAVLLLDVIEHLAEPEAFLVRLRNESRSLQAGQPSPTVILSVPNVAFAAVRLNLLLGRFNYAERGILDVTHKRLFTRASLLRMLRDCGYRVEKVIPVQVPFEAVMSGGLGRVLDRIAHVLAYAWPPLFAFQFMVVCRPLPGVLQVLRQAERHTGQDVVIPEGLVAKPPESERRATVNRDPAWPV